MDNEEIDLRPWLRGILRRWKIVVSLALLGAILLASVVLLQPRASQASVAIVIAPNSTQITLDQRFASRDATLLTNASFQRQALIGIATSNELAQRVAIELGMLNPTQVDLVHLHERIRLQVQGDLIQITATAPTDQEALVLAEVWGRQYTRLTNEIYSRDSLLTSSIAEQLENAEARYRAEQQALEAFLAQNRIFEVEYQQRTLQNLVDSAIEAEKNVYNRYWSLTQQLDLIIQDAETLRKQVGSASSDDLANTLGLLALHSRANGANNLPIELNIESITALRARTVTLEEVDNFIAVVREERDRIAAESTALADRIIAAAPGLTSLDPATRDRYQSQLAALRREAENIRAEERLLTQRRDTALNSVELLRRKLEEQRIAELTPQFSLRMLGVQASAPPSMLLSLVLFTGAGLVAGLSVGVLGALIAEIVSQRRQAPQRVPPIGEPAPQNAIKPS